MGDIVSLVYGREIPDMGRKAESLLKNVECSKDDSAGAAFIDTNGNLTILKNIVGTKNLCRDRPICSQTGQRFIGHRSVHRVDCRAELVGAIASTINNEESLRTWLLQRNHIMLTSSEDELFIHLVEDHYAASTMLSSADIARMRQAYAHSGQGKCMPDAVLRMIDSIRKADAIMEGSYAAVMADPRLPGLFAMRSGRELSAYRNVDEWGDYIVFTTRRISTIADPGQPIVLAEGEGIWCTENSLVSFSLRGVQAFPRRATSSAIFDQPL
jgi:hypothetical protein